MGPTIDIFCNRRNRQFKRYIGIFYDRSAVAQDCLSISWRLEVQYLHPARFMILTDGKLLIPRGRKKKRNKYFSPEKISLRVRTYLLAEMSSSFGLLDQERAYGAQFVFKQQISSQLDQYPARYSSCSSQDQFVSNIIRRDAINMLDKERYEILAKKNFNHIEIDPEDPDIE
ncbi:MAG: hypothetical protein EZS28_003794 [Streblomastix strix]|uniref:Uncharacterized protein n=1 Tax=Streblomastix strix TaxID=222440 RepID=A0A5J4X0V2_9EUKA|nr:MAG: hypothetical protein EZS28_003794 [Streblomastix strix]